MLNKIKMMFLTLSAMAFLAPCAYAADIITSDNSDTVVADIAATEDAAAVAEIEAVSADAVAAYNPDGSLFQQITDLEQEKVLMELEKERAQLDLELDRLAAEKIKLHMEIDALSGRAEQQQQELENAQAELEAQAARLEREKEALAAQSKELASRAASASVSTVSQSTNSDVSDDTVKFDEKYRLINVVGADAQLQATIQDLSTGQNKVVSVGKTVDGYMIQSISVDEGVVFEKDGDTQTLNISKSR